MEPDKHNPEPKEPDNADAAPEATDTAATDPVDAPPDDGRVAALEAEIVELKDRVLRAAAEMENMRKRNERQIEDAHKYAVTNFARDMLGVADNLERALAAVPPEQRGGNELAQNLLGGVEAVEKGLIGILEKHNISRIEPLGEPFDPNRHEAVFEVPGSDYPPGTVAQVLQPGYMLNDRLLRPAMVGVAKGAAEGVDTTA